MSVVLGVKNSLKSASVYTTDTPYEVLAQTKIFLSLQKQITIRLKAFWRPWLQDVQSLPPMLERQEDYWMRPDQF